MDEVYAAHHEHTEMHNIVGVYLEVEGDHHGDHDVAVEQGPFPEGVQPLQDGLPAAHLQRAHPAHANQQQLQVGPAPRQERDQDRQRVHAGVPHVLKR